MWSFGLDEEHWGESSSFVGACQGLYDHVAKLAESADSSEDEHYSDILTEIGLVLADPAYREDPDQWEDKDFFDLAGLKVYYVVED